MYRFVIILIALTACGQKYADQRSAELLSELGKSTTQHFEFLMKAHGTPSCDYKSVESEKWRKEIDGQMRVISARVSVLEPDAKASVNRLWTSYEEFDRTLRLLDENPVSPSWEDKCMDAESIMKYQAVVEAASSTLESVLR